MFIPVAVIALISITLLYSFCKRSEKDEVIKEMSLYLLKKEHFSPPEINDQFSEKVFSAYLKRLDPTKQFLTQEDIRQMSAYKTKIDDEINNNSYELYKLSSSLLNKRSTEVQGYYREILSQPFDFTKDETYEPDPDKNDWPANSAELKDAWRKYMKYHTLVRLADMQKGQANAPDSVKNKTLDQLEADARKKVLKLQNDVFQYRNSQDDDDWFAVYMNAIVSVFDPHTIYNTPSDKDRFDISMSGQFEGIGAQLQASEGYAKVTMLVVGSPSWRQGELKVNDLITKVRQENEQEPVDVFGMRLDDIVKLIRGKKETKVILTVKRADGSIHNIAIVRDVVIDEETYAKSAVMTDPKTKTKVGYIYLPKFYADFNHTATGRASSDDVAKELEKLKKENVQGIILDLRNNGGGALGDVIKMSGLFVGPGPVVQVKANIGLPRVFSGSNQAPTYEGPLVIMVNSLSASASEIISAAMQDYQRAVIIGGPSTYGKGTVQTVADLNEYLPVNMNKLKPLGALFITIQKYFRINGGSTQLKGVTPDIVLPDEYSELGIGERFEDNYLPWTSVSPEKYKIWKKPVPVDQLRKKSVSRTSKNEGFKLIEQQIAVMKNWKNESSVPLKLEAFRTKEEKRIADSKRFDELNKKKTNLVVAPLIVDKAAIANDTAKIARSEKWISDLNTDIFIEEAVQVIGDMK